MGVVGCVVVGNSEVGDPGVQVPLGRALHQDIRRLDVAMDQSAAVRCSESTCGLDQEPQLHFQAEPFELVQSSSRNQPHGDEGAAIDLAGLVDLEDMGMPHLRLRPGLP